jgi:hypothetical protein
MANELIQDQSPTIVDNMHFECHAFANVHDALMRSPTSAANLHNPGEVELGHNHVLAATSPKLNDALTMAYWVFGIKAG